MKFFDTHCHLTDQRFHDDMETVVRTAAAGGVDAVVTVACGVDDMRDALSLRERIAGLVTCLVAGGLAPYNVAEADEEDLAQLELLLGREGVAALGEIGLDRHYSYSDPLREEHFFEAQLDMAVRRRLPVIIHCREAHPRMRALLEARRGNLPAGVVHCFSGTYDDAAAYLDLGFAVSFTCAAGYRNAHIQREVISRIPLTRIMAETDAPYLPPADRRGTRNEPVHVREIAGTIAAVRGMTVAETADALYTNAQAFFGVGA